MATMTSLGDPAVTASVALILFGSFLLASRAAAVDWMTAVAACALLTSAIKLALYALKPFVVETVMKSPSGHVAGSVLVYGTLSVAAARSSRRPSLIGLAALIVGLIATSRIYLRYHSAGDVVAGLVIGAVCFSWFATRCLMRPGAELPPASALASVLLCAMGVTMGWRLRVDHLLHLIAAYMAVSPPGARG